MTISKYQSSKITILNSVLIMMVLYIHSYYSEGEKYGAALALQRFLGASAFCGTANRLFFFLSGVLFFNGITQVRDCTAKIKKRIRSLLIPYLIWNVIFVLWYVVLHYTPGVDEFVNSNILGQFDTIWHGIRFLWITPASFPLWFLRDLLVMAACSPIIYLYIRYLEYWGVVLYLIFSLFIPNFGMFFVLGGAVAILSDLGEDEKVLPMSCVIACTFVFLIGCLYIAVQSSNYKVPMSLNFVMAITGMVTVWRGYDFIARGKCLGKSSYWARMMGYSFFIYLFHEPAFNIIKKIPIKLLGDSEGIVMFFFLLNPIIMAIVAIGVAKCLQRIMPNLYAILVGGR